MELHRAILRTGSALLTKGQIRHLRAFRMAVIKEGPDLQTFTHPGALTKLALWVSEAIIEQENGRGGKVTPLVLACLHERRGVYIIVGTGGRGLDIGLRQREKEAQHKEREKKREEKMLAKEKKREEKQAARVARKEANGHIADDDGDEDEDEEELETEEEASDEDDEDDGGNDIVDSRRNRFGNSFQEVVAETNARVRMESFDHCVIEVRKDDLGRFLESLSSKSVMG